MMTYLKNMGGYKQNQLKGNSYEEIQGLYERQQKRIQDFTPIDSKKEAQKPAKRLKRVTGSYATQKSPKKPKVMKFAKDVTEEEAAEYEKEKKDLAGSENRPPMLNKENYVPWSSRLLRYAKSRPNGKLIYNSIMNGPYARRMIPRPGDPARTVPVPEMFHEQTNDELTKA
ncbi:hypothetical protein Tco_0800923 [Tanacetum coccineum]|uniref:Uncharacterized protein n=1 Tax=Tanacetum coccineum TaxID=301880 RepID=A0ABQ4ZYB4_9ASTR